MKQTDIFIFPPIKIQQILYGNFIIKINLSLTNTPHFTYKITSPIGKKTLDFLVQYFFEKTNPQLKLPLNWTGISPFTKKVLIALSKNIGFGEWISYKELATIIGNPNSARAVGQALNKNPWPIIIPCHRVLKSTGSLGGFSSGINIKKFLLRHERIYYKK